MKKFFVNRHVNFVNVHYGIKMAAENLVLFFNSIYLYKVGIEIWKIFAIFAVIYLLRIMVRPLGMGLVLRNGLKKSVLIGSVSYSGLYMTLSQVTGLDIWLIIYMIYSAVNDVLYWLPFHAYYASLGKQVDRGKSMGVREALTSLAGILSPLIGGILIASFGFFILFVAASLLILASILPLLFVPDLPLGKQIGLKEAFDKISKRGFWLYLGEGWFSCGQLFVWPLIVFLLFNDYVKYGILFTAAIFFRTIGFLLVGDIVDKGKGKTIFYLSMLIGFFATILMSHIAYTVSQIMIFAVVYAFFACLCTPVLGTVFYNSSINSGNALWFQYFSENGWDAGCIIICSIVAITAFFGFDLRLSLAASSFGLLIVGIAGRKYFLQGKNI